MEDLGPQGLDGFDAVVIGAGLAGSVAACRAQELGCRCLLIDKSDDPSAGGNTGLSGGTIHAAGIHMKSPADVIRRRVEEVTGGETDPDLAIAFAEHSARALSWVVKSGVEIEPPGVGQAWRTILAPRRLFDDVHAWRDRGPQRSLQTLHRRLISLGGSILGGGTALDLLPAADSYGVGGVMFGRNGRAHRARASQVLLADGGFQANAKMLNSYIGPFADRIKLRASGSGTGDAIRMAEPFRAQLVKLAYFYGHLLHRSALTSDRLWPMPTLDSLLHLGILVSQSGIRTFDEGLGGIAAANTIARSDDPRGMWIVIGSDGWAAAEREGLVDPLYPTPVQDLEARGGEIYQAADPSELGMLAGINPERLLTTVTTFNDAVANRRLHLLSVPRTGTALALTRSPLRAIPAVPGITFTMGGLHTDAQTRVLDLDGKPIPGLLAAGGSAGGIQGGRTGGYVGGLSTALVFGFLAGEEMFARKLGTAHKRGRARRIPLVTPPHSPVTRR